VTLKDLIRTKQKQILKKWYNLILDTYPREAAAFFRKNRDSFENPVGARISQGIEGILENLLADKPDEEHLHQSVDNIVRIRAVQDFSPSEAVKFFLLLKKAIREVLAKELEEDPALLREFLRLEEEIDAVGLKAFDVYMACRERLYHLKVEEWKRNLYMLLRRAKLVYDPREGSLIENQT